MKKIFTIIIIAIFLVLSFLIFSLFIDFEKLTMNTWFSFELVGTLTGLSIFIFFIFVLLFLLKYFFPKFIINKYVTDNIHNPIYITSSCIVLVLIIPLGILKETSLTQFFLATFDNKLYLYICRNNYMY